VKRFRGGLVSEAHRLVHHSTLGLRVIMKKKKACRYSKWPETLDRASQLGPSCRCTRDCSTDKQLVQLLRRNVKRFRGGLVFKAHRLVYHSTLGWRAIKKKKKACRYSKWLETQDRASQLGPSCRCTRDCSMDKQLAQGRTSEVLIDKITSTPATESQFKNNYFAQM